MYKKIAELAKPFYKLGRPKDLEHIKWLVQKLFNAEELIRSKGYDFDIIYALTVLHDVGYAKLPKGYNPFDLETRKSHAEESAKIAEVILNKVNFPELKRKKTLRLIRHHDDWAFGNPPKDPEWRIFTDLDFSWEASKIGFDIVRMFRNETRSEFLKTVERHLKRKEKNEPFYFQELKESFYKDLKYWKSKIRS